MKKIGVLLIILSLFTFGCTRGDNSASTPDEYHYGTQGLELNFMRGTPPAKIYEGDDLSIIVEAVNKGAYPTFDSGQHFDGRIYVGGFDASYIPINPGNIQLDSGLYGRDQYNSDGTYDTETFLATSVSLPEETDTYSPTVQVTACYSYKTFASPVVCIDPEPFSSKVKNPVCTVRDQSLGGGQGAPVAVTRIEESVTRDNIKFKIYFRNVGNGYVIDESFITSDCPDTDRENINKVNVDVRLSGATASCKPQNPIRLVDGQGFVVCDTPKPSEGTPAYTTPLQIELSYGYSTSISKQVTIIND